jgi:hypothetical protein
LKIEPRHRKRFLADLNSDDVLWDHLPTTWQSTTNAVFYRQLDRNETERLTVTNVSLSDHMLVIADFVVLDYQDVSLSLDDVVSHLAGLVHLCSGALRGAVNVLTHSRAEPVAVEIHIESRGSTPSGTARTIADMVDLMPLGAGRGRGPTQGASVWPASWLTVGAERSLVLEALRNNALDWGYLDPDAAMTELGWQEGFRE